MSLNTISDEDFNSFWENLPEMKRRWEVTIFRNEPVEGGIRNVIVAQYNNVRPKSLSGIVRYDGVLHFVDDDGKEHLVSSVPYIAKEVTAAE